MKELMILKNDKLNNRVVNARDLHTELKSKREFANWMRAKVIENPAFIEDIDYSLYDNSVLNSNINTSEQTEGRGRKRIEYVLTLDTAKNVALMEHTEVGNRVRRHFIDCEKELYNQIALPTNYIDALKALLESAEHNKMQQAKLEHQAPKVEFFNAVASSKDNISMNEVAKVLNVKGFGRNNLFKFLRKRGILMLGNMPYQQYIDRGFFSPIEQKYEGNSGVHVVFKTLVTQKGLDFIRKQLNEYNNYE